MEQTVNGEDNSNALLQLRIDCSDVFNNIIVNYLSGRDYIMLKCTSKEMIKLMPHSWQNSEEIGNKILTRSIIQRKNAFITGPGGCGKTHTIKRILYHAEKLDLKIALLSTTGISASYIDGVTLHSFFGIGKFKNIEALAQRKMGDAVKARIKNLHFIIIDEVSMCGEKTFILIDYRCREATGIDKPMGGIPMILSGDFYQLPPVMDKLLFNGKLWRKMHFKMYKFEVSVRHKGDALFFNILNRVRKGESTTRDIKLLKSRNGLLPPVDDGIKAIYMFSNNEEANNKNQQEYAKVEGIETLAPAVDTVMKKVGKSWSTTNDYTVIQARKETAIQTHKTPELLGLKVGAQYYITVNVNQKKKLLNGTACIFMGMNGGEAVVTYAGGIANLSMKLFTFRFAHGGYALYRMQYPLKLGYAMTIHYSQGATLERAVIDTSKVFGSAQVYVALSRLTSLEGVYFIGFKGKHIRANKQVKEFYGDLTDEDLEPIKKYKPPVKKVVKREVKSENIPKKRVKIIINDSNINVQTYRKSKTN